MRVKEYIEKAVVAIIDARAGVTVPVVRFRDRLTQKGQAGFIVVHFNPPDRLSMNHDLYEGILEVMVDTLAQNDPAAYTFDDLIDEVTDEIQETMTEATLQAAIDAVQAGSGITVDGVDQGAEAPDENDENSQLSIYREKALIAFTYVKP